MEDTIAAISTSLGVGAISIIRISGKDSVKIVNKIFKGKDLEKVETHTINYGHIVDNNKMIDEVLVSVMLAPKTFTLENIVEINAHGGIATTNKILELLLLNGCRLAEPGEFTKRAFLNGRIDLIEAEGIMDLINAKTEKSLNLAINQLNGHVSDKIRELRKYIIEILANIEVNIDYEDIEEITYEKINSDILEIIDKLNYIIKESESGKIIKDGIDVAIIGKPNVGKSSLLNLLIEEEKAIVTDIEGTTRDIIEGKINLDGIILNIIDTAGIRKTQDTVEKIGVNKSIELIDKADLILFVLNNNEEISKEEIEILQLVQKKNHIIIVNKNDLENKLNTDIINNNYIKMSTKKNEGIDELKLQIKRIFNLDKIEQSDFTYLSNAHNIALAKQSLEHLNESKKSIDNKLPIDMIEIDLKLAWEKLGQIIGENYQDELIDQLFSQFCLGK